MTPTTDRIVLVDGHPAQDGLVSLDADDPGLLLGMSVFETLRTYNRRAFRIDAHLQRLHGSASALGVRMHSADLLKREIESITMMRGPESVVRVTLTGGGRRIVRAGPLPPVLSGYRCVTRAWTSPTWLPGTIKHSSRAASVTAVLQGCVDEVLWVDADGNLLEGTRSNVFGVVDGVLWTPPLDGRLLAGITRATVLEIAHEQGIPVRVNAMPHHARFDELYLSSTLKELCPIVVLDGVIAPGSGPVGQQISDVYTRLANA